MQIPGTFHSDAPSFRQRPTAFAVGRCRKDARWGLKTWDSRPQANAFRRVATMKSATSYDDEDCNFDLHLRGPAIPSLTSGYDPFTA